MNTKHYSKAVAKLFWTTVVKGCMGLQATIIKLRVS